MKLILFRRSENENAPLHVDLMLNTSFRMKISTVAPVEEDIVLRKKEETSVMLVPRFE
jgi:hypothetical protein